MSSNPFKVSDILGENLLQDGDENDYPQPPGAYDEEQRLYSDEQPKRDHLLAKSTSISSTGSKKLISDESDATPGVDPHHGKITDRNRPKSSTPIKIPGSTRLVIAIDYGTTYTGLAFAYTKSNEVHLNKIEVLQDWTPRMSNLQKVRSLISYTRSLNGEAQWGTDISNNAITNVNTKLELELQPSLLDELDLTLSLLRHTGYLSFKHLRKASSDSTYTCKSPTEIVTDYLTKIYECTKATIDIDTLAKTGTVVDVVVTVPVNWSYEANDATFKAIRGAGFNKENFPTLKDTVLVSEPEAASHFTARDLHASGKATENLNVGECFVLCDAGGGTVDVVSFQVKKIEPYFELEKATEPKSGKCGSAFIDNAFKIWLRQEIGVEEYAKLDPANARQRLSTHTVESGPMRQLIKRFEDKKKTFSNSSQDVKLTLPAPLNRLNIKDRVDEGELIIRHHEMRELINSCVSPIITLILEQINKISKNKNRRTKNVFLVGGFGASPYLQEELRRCLAMRKMRMYRPESYKPWTAVVQGGAIYGIEKARHTDASYMSSMTKSYGIRIEADFEWLIRKGDLVLSNEKRNVHSPWFSISRKDMAKCELPVYVYLDGDGEDDVPPRFEDGQSEVKRVGVVKCDFSKYLDLNLRAAYMHGRSAVTKQNPNSTIGPLRCQMQLSPTRLEVGVFLEKACVGRCEIEIDVEPSQRRSTDSWNREDD